MKWRQLMHWVLLTIIRLGEQAVITTHAIAPASHSPEVYIGFQFSTQRI